MRQAHTLRRLAYLKNLSSGRSATSWLYQDAHGSGTKCAWECGRRITTSATRAAYQNDQVSQDEVIAYYIVHALNSHDHRAARVCSRSASNMADKPPLKSQPHDSRGNFNAVPTLASNVTLLVTLMQRPSIGDISSCGTRFFERLPRTAALDRGRSLCVVRFNIESEGLVKPPVGSSPKAVGSASGLSTGRVSLYLSIIIRHQVALSNVHAAVTPGKRTPIAFWILEDAALKQQPTDARHMSANIMSAFT
ncbi:hypothetical protein GGX14DRAFT_400899 [Mycena pura]|uniref:Uncharacterized protein n=1 Tax=Mycena pura TaxID=153505 RepID=A0AAD6V258_9AGAR|nr:hypothetical protein GGX14DRAFT_400899 [Mycena pura]